MTKANFEKRPKHEYFNLNNQADIHTVAKQNCYMLAEYMQEERRGSALKRTPNKREQTRPNEQWGLESIYV